MEDAFGFESHTRVSKRTTRSEESQRFSPSYGVHRGLIPDPNWPPAHFPENSVAMQRKDRRVACRLAVELDGRRAEVPGDLSRGGVMFLLPERATASTISVEVRGKRARVEVLGASQRGQHHAHHARFVDPAAGAALWKALLSA